MARHDGDRNKRKILLKNFTQEWKKIIKKIKIFFLFLNKNKSSIQHSSSVFVARFKKIILPSAPDCCGIWIGADVEVDDCDAAVWPCPVVLLLLEVSPSLLAVLSRYRLATCCQNISLPTARISASLTSRNMHSTA